ncbi:hypothetical protein R3P38DRAFT_2555800 [Favolaschia claudopus]|uniref:phytol kinase n=1 Tax=Favolaschia claudopus TaxID=2862362 RepID=A0AAW0ABP3_9AGAR
MHPSLQPSNLARLLPSLRQYANAAVSGSTEATMAIIEGVLKQPNPQKLPLVLPVIYAALDPAKISLYLNLIDGSTSPADFQRNGIVWQQSMEKTFVLRCLWDISQENSFPVDALIDLWPRAWAWIQLLDELGSLVPGSVPIQARYGVFVSAFRLFRGNREVDRLMKETPKVFDILGRAWSMSLNEDKWDDDERYTEAHRLGNLSDVSNLLSSWFRFQPWGSFAFEQLILGAGGTRTHLASLVVSQITVALPNPDTTATDSNILPLLGIVCFIAKGPEDDDDEEVNADHQDTVFRSALLSEGIIPALTIAIQALRDSKARMAAALMRSLLIALLELVDTFPRHQWLAQSLRAGLLNAILGCGSSKHVDEMGGFLYDLLSEMLPAASIYHSVLCAFRVSLAQVSHIDVEAELADPDLLESWEEVMNIVRPRLSLLNKYDGDLLAVPRACDNLQCDKLMPRRTCKVCGNCRSSYYCSRLCQKADWNAGHRHGCAALRERRRSQSYSSTSAKDKSFFRALMHHEYDSLREEIALNQILFMHRNPRSTQSFVSFGFVFGTCDVSVATVEHLTPSRNDEGRQSGDSHTSFSYEVSRAARSEGKIQLHSMEVLDRPGSWENAQAWVFPTRLSLNSGRSALISGLREIADSLPQGADLEIGDLEEYRERVRELIGEEVTH